MHGRGSPRNALALNHDRDKKHMRMHDHNVCKRCGLIGKWSRTYHIQKHFFDLYQASLTPCLV